jgi:hypothetical protein
MTRIAFSFTVSCRLSEMQDKATTGKLAVRRPYLIKLLLLCLLLLTFSAAWWWTPLSEWVSIEYVIDWQQSVRNQPGAFFVVGAYLLAGGSFSVTILNLATIVTFGPAVEMSMPSPGACQA